MRPTLIKLISTIVFLFSAFFEASDGSSGVSSIYRKQDDKGNYQFGYDITDPWGASNFRKESGSFDKKGGSVEGAYGLQDVDGRQRLVKYSADENGFTAYIETNEPGTSDEDAADAIYNGWDKNNGKWKYDVTIKDGGGWDDGWGGGGGYKGGGYKGGGYSGWSDKMDKRSAAANSIRKYVHPKIGTLDNNNHHFERNKQPWFERRFDN